MPRVMRALQFCRLTDADNNLSLTNVALFITLGALVLRPGVAITDIAAMVATLVSYQAKRWMANTAPEAAAESADIRKALDEMKTKVTALQLGQQLKR